MVKKLALAAAALALSTAALAEVHVDQAWVRGTVTGQTATGAFMMLQSDADTRLVGASSPVAGVVQLHEMAMVNGVMRMREVANIDLPKGKSVELKPGDLHVMLMDLKQPVAAGKPVKITLKFQDAKGKKFEREVMAPVRALGAEPAGAGHHGHNH